MHIAHSAFRNKTKAGHAQLSTPEMQQRIAAYHATCKKYKQEIAAIQKYLPGWMPAFDAALSR
ncbi:hypothetical protein [Mucilaginibacter psychrotolerans]|uniref:Uncharacterized protein n=1 Tax=Mucilaginibacter psychrotolerans TaxID=1524096 RepID=A0A4Y8S4M4_9SPHI|nr:hypothetical protein [Mucilaginibacter psychrotolerans]TFF33417.1 hypothetical protein E2R66_26150 [Mucilaginibacter psychrotolerans]